MKTFHIEINTDGDFSLPKYKDFYAGEWYSFSIVAESLYGAVDSMLEGLHIKDGYEASVVRFFADIIKSSQTDEQYNEGALGIGNYYFLWSTIAED